MFRKEFYFCDGAEESSEVKVAEISTKVGTGKKSIFL